MLTAEQRYCFYFHSQSNLFLCCLFCEQKHKRSILYELNWMLKMAGECLFYCTVCATIIYLFISHWFFHHFFTLFVFGFQAFLTAFWQNIYTSLIIAIWETLSVSMPWNIFQNINLSLHQWLIIYWDLSVMFRAGWCGVQHQNKQQILITFSSEYFA